MNTPPPAPGGEKVVPRCCGDCRYFCNAPAAIEAAFRGLSAMSSGHASVRAQDGLCERHGLYLAYRDCCSDFAAREK